LDQGYDQLVGKSYSRTDVHAHVARRPKAVSAAPKAPEPRDTWDRRTPMNPQQVPKVTPRETPREILEERSERSERSAKVRPPPSVPSAAPTASATSSPSAPSAPSKPRPADPNAAPEKPPYILRLEESARAFARVNRERRRKQGPASARQKVHGGVQSGASIGSASTASTTPESVRKRLLAGSEAGYHRHGGHLLLEHGTDLRDLQRLWAVSISARTISIIKHVYSLIDLDSFLVANVARDLFDLSTCCLCSHPSSTTHPSSTGIALSLAFSLLPIPIILLISHLLGLTIESYWLA